MTFYLRQHSISVIAIQVVDLKTDIVLSLGFRSTGLLIAWAILYRRSHKPEVLALDASSPCLVQRGSLQVIVLLVYCFVKVLLFGSSLLLV